MVRKNHSTVSEYLDSELHLNRLVKLSEEEAESVGIHYSPIGLIPKRNKPGKWRLIVDLSSPEGASVNDGVDKELFSLSYTSVDVITSYFSSASMLNIHVETVLAFVLAHKSLSISP